MPELSGDFLCLLEAATADWKWAQKWVEKEKERRLVFVDATFPEVIHPQVKWVSIDSPLSVEKLAKEVAWEAVFLKMETLGAKSEMHSLFQQKLEETHLAAKLLLSDAADWGSTVAKHSFLMKSRPVRDGMALKGAFAKIPAIIVGAGPSLEKNGHYLKAHQNEALIFAGGTALNKIAVEPHFAASIDKEAPYSDFKRHPFHETPFCFQSRMNPENFSLIHGEAIIFPDSHFQFLDSGATFDGGWTVGTFLISIATLMGCDPIILVGMDYSYEEGRKYAGGEVMSSQSLIETSSLDGRKVWTQPDWLMAKKWIEQWALKSPEKRFLNATEGGLGFALPVVPIELKTVSFEKQNIKELVQKRISTLPIATPFDWEGWKKSLERCQKIASSSLFGAEEDFEDERAYEMLLFPLWRIWSPVFKRALEDDPNPDKLKINRLLFFEEVIQEHLRAIE